MTILTCIHGLRSHASPHHCRTNSRVTPVGPSKCQGNSRQSQRTIGRRSRIGCSNGPIRIKRGSARRAGRWGTSDQASASPTKRLYRHRPKACSCAGNPETWQFLAGQQAQGREKTSKLRGSRPIGSERVVHARHQSRSQAESKDSFLPAKLCSLLREM